MEISLYTGSENPAEYYTDFLTQNKINFKITSVNSELIITVYANDAQTEQISEFLCRFMIEFYLKEAVFSKIYDEYPTLGIEDASIIMLRLSDELASGSMKKNIQNSINLNGIFKPESYVLFNIKSVMMSVYSEIDKLAIDMVYQKEKERLQSAIRFLKGLNFDKCETADDDL